jgi:serine/threonine protein kinase
LKLSCFSFEHTLEVPREPRHLAHPPAACLVFSGKLRITNEDYLVMERSSGKPLQQVFASSQQMSTRSMLDYCAQMARIVDIHAAGWVWRDCKPAKTYLCS